MKMAPDDVKTLIANGENERLELKASLPTPQEVARHLAALANTSGGHLVLGVKEPSQAIGVNERKAVAVLNSARQHLSPPIEISVQALQLDGHPIVIATVPKSSHLIGAAGGYYRRNGDRFRPISAEELKSRTKSVSQDEALWDLSKAVAAQTETVDRLREDVARANSLPRKTGIAILGAAVGAALKWLADTLL